MKETLTAYSRKRVCRDCQNKDIKIRNLEARVEKLEKLKEDYKKIRHALIDLMSEADEYNTLLFETMQLSELNHF